MRNMGNSFIPVMGNTSHLWTLGSICTNLLSHLALVLKTSSDNFLVKGPGEVFLLWREWSQREFCLQVLIHASKNSPAEEPGRREGSF